ncbi:ANTAR domain protein [compost metagenome]
MRFLLVVREFASPLAKETCTERSKISTGTADPEYLLKANGYQVFSSDLEAEIYGSIKEADAAILQLSIAGIKAWSNLLNTKKALPLLWWCSPEAASASLQACEEDVLIDGILTPTMTAQELHWSLHFGAKHFFERQQWQTERAGLVSRLEERKWIDLAKRILCDVNNISEAEAYDVLRKRAMNERKRIVDIATTIVKAHQQLRT